MGRNVTIGSTFHTLKSTGTVAEGVLNAKRAVEQALAFLVLAQIATKVTVTATYVGAGAAKIEIEASGNNGVETRVGVTATRKANSWAWSI